MKKHNLHCHSNCSDGSLSPEILAVESQRKGIEILGISDHAFSQKLSKDMLVTNIEEYIARIRAVANSSGLDLKAGLEIDVSTEYGIHPFELPEIVNKLDYLLFEYVDTKAEHWGIVNGREISALTITRNNFKLPIGLAHNDLQKNYVGKESEIAGILAENDIFVELCQSEFSPRIGAGRNSRGGKDYYKHFSPVLIDALVKNEVNVVVGSDTHTGESLGNVDEVIQFIQEHGLKYHKIIS